MLEALAPSLAALALVAAAGCGLQAMLPEPLEASRTARLGLAYLLGLAWIGLGGWALGFAGVALGRTLWLVLALAPIVAGAAAVVFRRGAGGLAAGTPPIRSIRWPTAIAVLVLAGESVALLAHTSAEPVTDFDGRMTWGTQARYLEASGSVLPDVLRDERAFVIHPRYPILLPLLQIAAVQLAGLTLEGFGVRPLYALFLPALAAALWPALRRAGGARGAAFATLLLFTAPLVWGEREAGPLGTYSDFPLAAFLGAGFAQLLHPRARREPWRGGCAGLLLAAAAGSKNEGLLLATAAIVLVGCLRRGASPRGRAALVRASAVLSVALVLIVAWRSRIPNRNDEGYFESFSISTLVTNLPDRFGAIAATTVERSLDRDAWGFLFWLLPPLLLLGRRGLARRDSRVALAFVAVEVGMAAFAYATVGDPAIMPVTWNRFVLQMSAPLALVLAATSSRLLVSASLGYRAAR